MTCPKLGRKRTCDASPSVVSHAQDCCFCRLRRGGPPWPWAMPPRGCGDRLQQGGDAVGGSGDVEVGQCGAAGPCHRPSFRNVCVCRMCDLHACRFAGFVCMCVSLCTCGARTREGWVLRVLPPHAAQCEQHAQGQACREQIVAVPE